MLADWRSFRIFLLVTAMLGACLAGQAMAQAADKKPGKLFGDNSELQVTLSGPWREIRRNIKDDKLYPAQLNLAGESGQQKSFQVEVAPRGVSRRFRVCDFPPLKVHFDKKAMKGTIFRGNKSLKLVTYCDSNSKYEQYIVKEFLAYRIYNLLTDYSFRVRPMRISYVDSKKGGKPIVRFGFFIEDIDDVAKRNGKKKLDIPDIPFRELEPGTSSIMSLFQFMIGNLDWAATSGPREDRCCHNTRLIGESNEAIPKFPIPYDFDSTGLVDAHYAAPPNQLKMRNIRQRLYRGFCKNKPQLGETVSLFNQKKQEILGLVEQNTWLNDRSRTSSLRYLEGFYDIINDPGKLEKQISDRCRGKP